MQRVREQNGNGALRSPLHRRTLISIAFAVVDALIVVVAYVAALELRFGGRVPGFYFEWLPNALAIAVPVHVIANHVFGMNWRGWRHASLIDALSLTRSVALATVLVFAAFTILFPGNHPLPLSVVPVAGAIALIGMGVVRFRYRLLQEVLAMFRRVPQQRVLIVGAGVAGQRLARELRGTPLLGYRPLAFVDDDSSKQDQRIHGLRVAGPRSDIPRLVRDLRADVVAVAIPSLDMAEEKRLLDICLSTTARVKIVPGLPQLLTSKLDTPVFRDVHLDDLLVRESVHFRDGALAGPLAETVLVTGAAGSIGSELARQIVRRGAKRVVLLDINESGIFDLENELRAIAPATTPDIVSIVADVTRERRIAGIFTTIRPNVVFHAAAYKHVPLMEAQPQEAVITNVLGTRNICDAAEQVSCDRVVLISSDKAVDPSNVMGATKRAGERILESFALDSKTVFCSVRFGNVLGSRGSVVPTFEKQIQRGGPVTITHRDMTRFFMTIPEAVNLIIEASEQAQGGEIFILDMGKPVAIIDLATKLIRLHGLRPGIDIAIVETGVRPGEKMHEALASATEDVMTSAHELVLKVRPHTGSVLDRMELLARVEHLISLAGTQPDDMVVEALYTLVGGHRPERLPTPVEPTRSEAMPVRSLREAAA